MHMAIHVTVSKPVCRLLVAIVVLAVRRTAVLLEDLWREDWPTCALQGMPWQKVAHLSHAPDAVCIACPGLGACRNLCWVEAVVRRNVHTIQALKGQIVLVSMGVYVEAQSCVPREPLPLLEGSGELAGSCLPSFDVNDLLCLSLGPLGMPLLPMPAGVH